MRVFAESRFAGALKRALELAILGLLAAIAWVLITGGGDILWAGRKLFSFRHDGAAARVCASLVIIRILMDSAARARVSRLLRPLEALAERKATPWLIAGFFAALLAWIKVAEFLSFHTHAIDLSMFDQAVSNTLHGRFMHTTVLRENFFHYHFCPILLLFVPFYALYDSPLVLLVAQGLAVGASALPLFFIARQRLGAPFAAALLTVAWLGNRFLMDGAMYNFHIELLEPLFFLAAFAALETRRWIPYFACLILALMCKEDVGLYTFGLGCYGLLSPRTRRMAVVTLVLSVAWFVVSVKLVKPPAEALGDYRYLSRYGKYGSSFVQVAANMALHPHWVAADLLSKTTFKVLGTVLFLPLAAPLATLLLCGPPLLVNLTADSMCRKLVGYYAAPVVPFVFIAAVLGLANLCNRWPDRRRGILWIVCAFLLLVNLGHWKWHRVTERHAAGRALLRTIPSDARIIAQGHLVPQLAPRPEVYVLNDRSVGERADYVILDLQGPTVPFKKDEFDRLLARYRESPDWRLAADEQGFLVFQKR